MANNMLVVQLYYTVTITNKQNYPKTFDSGEIKGLSYGFQNYSEIIGTDIK